MKVLLLLFLAALNSAITFHRPYSMERAKEYFEDFIINFDKHYADEAEKAKRFEIFKKNLKRINQKNLESNSDVYGITKFSDLTKEEFIAMHTGLRGGMLRQASECTAGSVNTTSPPDSWSWKDKGVISKAKDQDLCGSCWAFGAIGNIEARYAMKHKDLLDLSEQQLVDCDNRSYGCNGTEKIEYPFLYLKQFGAMEEKDYPYQARNGKCKFDASKVKVKVEDCISYTPKTEEELKDIVYNSGPMSIGVDAIAMMDYDRGILENCPFKGMNHVVLLVGYGTENGTPYWLIKNSWGEIFGEDGFIRIKRGVNACGLMTESPIGAVVS